MQELEVALEAPLWGGRVYYCPGWLCVDTPGTRARLITSSPKHPSEGTLQTSSTLTACQK